MKLCQAFFLFLLLSSPVSAESHLPSLAEVSFENVNVRAGQSVNFEKLGKLPQGTTVVVVEESYGWYKIKACPANGGATAPLLCFISRKYIRLLPDGRGVVTGNKVNLRADPNVEAAQIGQLTQDSIVKIVATRDDFYQIEPMEGVYGWVSTQFLSLKPGAVPPTQEVEKFSAAAQVVAQEKAPKVVSSVEVVLKISVSGRLEKSSEGTHYQVVLTDGTRYILNAPSQALEPFLEYTLKVQGTKGISSSGSFATINPNRIECVL